ncbi:hypothetical protein [Caballeronia sp. GAFFF1]|uniref:hypothetical protein n=1 Tax=Caballeronia sp. GAFFF1 TaxID=2921779 RepID=UPI00202788DB|nr:hypothetical protein [Caballeronia sp. GAFFF1]
MTAVFDGARSATANAAELGCCAPTHHARATLGNRISRMLYRICRMRITDFADVFRVIVIRAHLACIASSLNFAHHAPFPFSDLGREVRFRLTGFAGCRYRISRMLRNAQIRQGRAAPEGLVLDGDRL